MDPDGIKGQIQELNSLRKQKRIWQYGAAGCVILIAVVCLLRLRSSVRDLVNEGPAQKAFVEDLGKNMQTKIVPAVQDLGSQALREINLAEEVKNLNKRTPELAKASLTQLDELSKNLPKRGEKVWKSTFEAQMKSRDSKVKQMFPELTPEQSSNVMSNLLEAAQVEVVDINDTLFGKHQQALKEIEASIEQIKKTEPKGQVEPASWEMALMVFDIAREDLRALETKPETAKAGVKSSSKGDKK